MASLSTQDTRGAGGELCWRRRIEAAGGEGRGGNAKGEGRREVKEEVKEWGREGGGVCLL